MSKHEVLVVMIEEVNPHPNADLLEIVPVWGYQVVVKKGQFKVGDLAIYIELDYVVPQTEMFSFIQGSGRIKPKRLRGVWSQGLLIPAEEGMWEGQDVMDLLRIYRYHDKSQLNEIHDRVNASLANEMSSIPQDLKVIPKYGLNNFKKEARQFFRPSLDKEYELVALEKLHGMNAMYVFFDGEMYVKSHNTWRNPEHNTEWARVLRQYEWITEWCKKHPGSVLFGEIVGTQFLKYGLKNGNLDFYAFDVQELDGQFWNYNDFVNSVTSIEGSKVAPEVWRGYAKSGENAHEEIARLALLADGKSLVDSSHIREGVVIRPFDETYANCTRFALKIVSDEYLTNKNA